MSARHLILIACMGVFWLCGSTALMSGTAAAAGTAKACRMMPIAELERALKSKAGMPMGTDGEDLSTCSVMFGAKGAKIQYARPGQAGLPTDLQMMLAIPRDAAQSNKSVVIKTFGNIGCYAMRVPAPVNEWASTCGDPRGFITLSIAGGNRMFDLKTLASLLAAASRRI